MKKFAAMIIAGITMVSCISVWAAEETVQESQMKQQQVQSIVLEEEIENGLLYGIIPNNWVEQLGQTISTEQIDQLSQLVEEKVKEIDKVKKHEKEKVFTAEIGNSQKAVLEVLYKAICQYDFGFDNQVEAKQGVEYLKALEVIDSKISEEDLKQECSVKQAAIWATKLIDKIYDGEDAGAKGFFWKVENNDNTVYMLGSIHIANHSIYPFADDILEAYEESETIGFEVDLNNQEGLNYYISTQMYTDDHSLKDYVSDGLYEKVMKATEELQGDKEVVSKCKPWALALAYQTMLSTMGLTDTNGTLETEQVTQAATLGIDNYILKNTTMDGKEIFEMEGYKGQADMLESFSPQLDEYFLDSSLEGLLGAMELAKATNKETNEGDNKEKPANKVTEESEPEKEINDIGQWLEQWKDGDVEGFNTSYGKMESIDENSPYKKELEEYNRIMFYERNEKMSEKIKEWLKQGGKHTMFVVVGAGHYVGKTGIIEQLTEQGYTVTQIK